jgi:hypothetical protein
MSKIDSPPERFSPNWMAQLDGRTGVAQAMRERYTAFTNDLGGAASLSYAQLSLVSRALWLEYWLQQQEQSMAAGGEVDIGRWTQGVNSLQGILAKLGLQRQARDVPSLGEYMKQRAGA